MTRILLFFFFPLALSAQKLQKFEVTKITEDRIELQFEKKGDAEVELYKLNGTKVIQSFTSKPKGKAHSIYFKDLEAGTFYSMKLKGKSKTNSNVLATASRNPGEIEIIFNKPSDTKFSDGSLADGYDGDDIEKAMLDIIKDAESTLDVCGYNTNRTIFVNTLIDAHNRGVRVRYIADKEQNNTALDTSLPFEVLFGAPDNGIMHNKWIIADVDDSDNALVLTGSTNFTTGQIFNDPNHIITFYDRTLAQAFTIEFEEMWGGSGDSPNFSNSKFGDDKSDNTPHFFNVGGVPVELYFSPTDEADQKVVEQIQEADDQLLCALLLFTRNEIENAITNSYSSDKDYRLIIEDPESSEDVIDDLQQAEVPFHIHQQNEIFHHKYAVIDEATSDPTVITGSMNWTFSGGDRNDENTVIIKDKSIANIFRQDFEAEWKKFISSTESEIIKHNVEVSEAFDSMSVSADFNIVELIVYNASGSKVLHHQGATSFSTADLGTGVYILMITGKGIRSPYKFAKK